MDLYLLRNLIVNCRKKKLVRLVFLQIVTVISPRVVCLIWIDQMMRSLALLKCSWRNTGVGFWRRLWWRDRLNMQRWFIMEFLLFCQVLNTQGMPNLEIWISECLKHNEEVRIHLRKPVSNLPSPMGQYKFYFPFSEVENSRRCIFQHQTLVSTIHLRICCKSKKISTDIK